MLSVERTRVAAGRLAASGPRAVVPRGLLEAYAEARVPRPPMSGPSDPSALAAAAADRGESVGSPAPGTAVTWRRPTRGCCRARVHSRRRLVEELPLEGQDADTFGQHGFALSWQSSSMAGPPSTSRFGVASRVLLDEHAARARWRSNPCSARSNDVQPVTSACVERPTLTVRPLLLDPPADGLRPRSRRRRAGSPSRSSTASSTVRRARARARAPAAARRGSLVAWQDQRWFNAHAICFFNEQLSPWPSLSRSVTACTSTATAVALRERSWNDVARNGRRGRRASSSSAPSRRSRGAPISKTTPSVLRHPPAGIRARGRRPGRRTLEASRRPGASRASAGTRRCSSSPAASGPPELPETRFASSRHVQT